MRFSLLSVGLLAVLTPLTSAWTKEDREIFRLRDELAQHEGPDMTFYDFLGVTSSASQDEINKAYRKKSKSLHPDKVKQQLSAERTKAAKAKSKEDKAKKGKGKKPGVTVTKPPNQSEIKAAVKAAGDRQARLSIIANILRGSGRARYDHFMSNGFPTWKGTEYYYSRYRPGLGTVLFGCLLVGGGGFHYIALYMSWKRQREFVERYIKFARQAAWGENIGIPGVDGPAAAPAAPTPPPPAADDEQQPPMAMNRKQRRWQERETRKESAKEGRRQPRGRARVSQQGSGSATPVPQNQGPGPQGAKKRVVAENGKVLVVDSIGDVFLEQEDADGNVQEFLLDPNELSKPTVKDTALFKLPFWAYAATLGRVFGTPKSADNLDEDEDDEIDVVEEELADDSSSEPQRTPSTDSAEDFELLEKSTSSLGQAGGKATGSQQQGGKAKKRNKKR